MLHHVSMFDKCVQKLRKIENSIWHCLLIALMPDNDINLSYLWDRSTE